MLGSQIITMISITVFHTVCTKIFLKHSPHGIFIETVSVIVMTRLINNIESGRIT